MKNFPAVRRAVWIFAFLLSWSVVASALPNDVDYSIQAQLDTVKNVITAQEQVRFVNHTGAALSEIWFHLYPNAFKKNSNSNFQQQLQRIGRIDPSRLYANPNDDAFIDIKSLSANGQDLQFSVNDTLMRAALAKPLADGEEIKLSISFIYDLMEAPSSALYASSLAIRSAHRRGVYTMTLWFPKVVVYDNKNGWNLVQFGYVGEFYSDFGAYHIELTLPSEMVVAATGVMTKETVNGALKTQVWDATNVHDFAWVASSRYQVTETKLANNTIVRTIYLNLSQMHSIALDAVQYFNQQFGAYPYPVVTVAQVEAGGGMEFPGIVMIGGGGSLEVVHELAHQWWYGTVGNNEEDEAWLDEGFATFSQELYDIEHLGRAYQTARSSFNFREPGVSVLTSASKFNSLGVYANSVYTKGSGVLWMLRGMLGKEKFDQLLRTYYDRLKFKNAMTPDFAAVSEEVSGQKLDWFFDEWLRTTKTLDFAATRATSAAQSDGTFNLQATVTRAGEAIMPVRVQFVLADGSKLEEIWDGQSAEKQFTIQTKVALLQVIVDPDQDLLEQDRTNNAGFAQNRTTVVSLPAITVSVFAHLTPE
ncbi:M1 family metallopeptidase [Candidatus Acetothermia bacterium]|nr:M1 family metallopeptidase [Candidatus Acetothermia bacterium]